VKDSRLLVTTAKAVLERLHMGMGRKVDTDVLIGAMLHVGCMVERLVKGESCHPFPKLEAFVAQNGDAVALARAELRVLEEMYEISITDSEVAYIVQMVLECQPE
jgi:transcriptional regulatory protein LevR